MTTDGTQLARSWPRLWRLPQVWALVAAGNQTVPGLTLTNAVLRSRLDLLSDSEAFEELLSAGEFAAAAVLLETQAFAALFSEPELRGMRRRLEAARRDRGQRLETQIFVLTKRAERLGSRARAIFEHLGDARLLVRDRADQAELALDLVDQVLTETERSVTSEIERLVNESAHPADADGLTRWKTAIADCVNRGDWEVAERWARAGVSSTVAATATRSRRPWPENYPVRVAFRWFAGDDSETPRPPTFDREWGIKPDDAIGRQLAESVRALEEAGIALTEVEVGSFLDAVEAAVSSDGTRPPEPREFRRIRVKLQDGTATAIVSRLRGLAAPGFYSFSTPDYDLGLSVLFTTAADPTIRDASEGAVDVANGQPLAEDLRDDVDGAVPTVGTDEENERQQRTAGNDTAITLVYGPLPVDRPRDSLVTLRATDVLRWVGDDVARPATIRQTIGGRVPLRVAFPRAIPNAQGDFLIGRDDVVSACGGDAARILIAAPQAGGRSAIVHGLARSLSRSGGTILDAQRSSLDPADLLRRLSDCPRGMLVCDDLESLPPGRAMELVAAAAMSPTPQPVVLTVSHEFVWLHESGFTQWRVMPLSPLTWGHAYEMTEQLIEPLGIEFATKAVLDRFSFYTSGHPGLIHCLLWQLCQDQDTGTRGGRLYVSSEQLAASFESRSFREQAAKLLLAVLERHPALQVVLGALLLEQAGSTRPVSGSELCAWPELAGLVMKSDQVDTALRRLSELWLCDAMDRHGKWRLSSTGIGTIVLDAVGDPGSYLEIAVSRCARLSDGSLLSV